MDEVSRWFLLVAVLGLAVGAVGGLRLAFILAGIAFIAICPSIFSYGYGFEAGMLYLFHGALPYTLEAALGTQIRDLRMQKRR